MMANLDFGKDYIGGTFGSTEEQMKAIAQDRAAKARKASKKRQAKIVAKRKSMHPELKKKK